MLIALLIILAYLIGSIPSGLIVGKLAKGIDIREHGSGNLGATNAFRTLGVKAGSVVIAGDILKGTLATALPFLMHVDIHPLLAGVFAVLGHVFPIFAKFKAVKPWRHQEAFCYFTHPCYLSRWLRYSSSFYT